jgi:cysteine-rich PDZ-binding protein
MRASNKTSALITSAPIRRRDLALGAVDALVDRRPINENKALAAKRRGPYGVGGRDGAAGAAGTKCKVCMCSLHGGNMYCNPCAHSKGMCARCGVVIMDTSMYNGHDTASTDEKAALSAREAVAPGVKDRRDVCTEDLEAKPQEDVGKKKVASKKAAAAAETSAPVEAAPTPLAGPTSAADVAREMGQAANGGAVSGWRFDKASGYFYDVAAQVYYDQKTGGYFDCKTQTWTMPEAKTKAEMQTGRATGTFKEGTRKPDRFGL